MSSEWWWIITPASMILLVTVWLPTMAQLLARAAHRGWVVGGAEGHVRAFRLIEDEKNRSEVYRSVVESAERKE